MTEPDHEVAIIGAGPGGIAAAHLLRKRGIDDFAIIERADDFGGTWRDNHYPGLAVDIPSLWYQLSFAPNPDWSRLFASGPELHRHPYPEVFVLAKGRAEFEVGGARLVAGAGDIVIAPAGAPHRFRSIGTDRLQLTAIHTAPVMDTDWLPSTSGQRPRRLPPLVDR